MIYCVVPEALEDELFDKLVEYYQDDQNVTVIIERRRSDRRGHGDTSAADAQQRQVRDRRRARVPGEFPELDTPTGD